MHIYANLCVCGPLLVKQLCNDPSFKHVQVLLLGACGKFGQHQSLEDRFALTTNCLMFERCFRKLHILTLQNQHDGRPPVGRAVRHDGVEGAEGITAAGDVRVSEFVDCLIDCLRWEKNTSNT